MIKKVIDSKTARNVLIFLYMNTDVYMHLIYRKLGITSGYIRVIIKMMIKEKLINFHEKYEYKKIIILTEKGKNMAKLLMEIEKL
jgi:DNA-binding MarR family transcriptional regulator